MYKSTEENHKFPKKLKEKKIINFGWALAGMPKNIPYLLSIGPKENFIFGLVGPTKTKRNMSSRTKGPESSCN